MIIVWDNIKYIRSTHHFPARHSLAVFINPSTSHHLLSIASQGFDLKYHIYITNTADTNTAYTNTADTNTEYTNTADTNTADTNTILLVGL